MSTTTDEICSFCPKSRDEHGWGKTNHQFTTTGELNPVVKPSRPEMMPRANDGLALRLALTLFERGSLTMEEFGFVMTGAPYDPHSQHPSGADGGDGGGNRTVREAATAERSGGAPTT